MFRTGVAVITAFAVLGVGAGWWQVAEAQRLSTAADNPAVIAIARRALRGAIEDRNGEWLARSDRDANGEADPRVPRRDHQPRRGLRVPAVRDRRASSGPTTRSSWVWPGADPVADLVGKFGTRSDQRLGLRLSLDLRLQRAAIRGLGDDHGAVVMLDPTTGEVLALASTPVYDASAIANPATATAAFTALQDDDEDRPLLPRATLGRYVPGSVFKIVTGIAALNTGAVDAGTTFDEQPPAEIDGLDVDGFRVRDGHHEMTGDRALDLAEATEVSCNIWYALAGLRTGGDRLVQEAAKLGFGAAIPFDLPTAVSSVTSGDGRLPGGFTNEAELASASFGQGETFVTPLQMAQVAAAVANDGVLMKPRLVTALTGDAPGARSIDAQELGRVMSEEDARTLQAAMQQAVEGTLGRGFTAGAAIPGISTAGKSGTAELGGRGEPHSWFIGFAPVENPKVAIAVLVERGGRGGERAAPLAGELMERYFELYGRP